MSDKDIFNSKFSSAFSDAKKEFGAKRPNILICGYTGSGKSSLIQTLLGNDIVPAEKIGSGSPKTMNFDRFENDKVVVWDSRGLELGETEDEFMRRTREFLNARTGTDRLDDQIHIVWYTIQGSGARVTDCDVNLMKNIFSPNSVIAVITKSDCTRPQQLEAVTSVIQSRALIPKDRIIPVSDMEGGAIGVKSLMELTYEMLPNAYQEAFLLAQKVDKERAVQVVLDKKEKANLVIKYAIAVAGGIGAVPLPFSDALALVPVQMTMIAKLAAIYGLNESAVRHAVWPILGQTAGVMAASSLTKLIPGLGSLVSAAVASSITGAMGWYVQKSFEKSALAVAQGEKMPEPAFDVASFMEFFNQYKKGKK